MHASLLYDHLFITYCNFTPRNIIIQKYSNYEKDFSFNML